MTSCASSCATTASARDVLPQVFEMFRQADRPALERRAGGLGIGLTLVRQLAGRLHGGSVAAQRQQARAARRVRVRLPIASTWGPPGSPTTPQAHFVRILVADDNRDNVETLALMLELQGHESATAYDGIEALAAAERICPCRDLDLSVPR